MKGTLTLRWSIGLLGVLAMLAISFPALADNDEGGGGLPPGDPAAIGCEIRDNSSNLVTTMNAMSTGDPVYWLRVLCNGYPMTGFQFNVVPLFSGSPFTRQRQLFKVGFPSWVQNYITPFGVPAWEGDLTSGAWRMTVKANGGQIATCDFTVEP